MWVLIEKFLISFFIKSYLTPEKFRSKNEATSSVTKRLSDNIRINSDMVKFFFAIYATFVSFFFYVELKKMADYFTHAHFTNRRFY